MGILDDVVINAKSAAEAVSRKAGQIVDISKLRISAAELNSEISKRYEVLGRYVYETSRQILAGDPEAVGKMAEIDELKTQATAIAQALGDKQNKVVCPTCGKQCSNTDQFCAGCGTKLATEPQPEPIPQEGGPNDQAAAEAAKGPEAHVSDIPPRDFP